MKRFEPAIHHRRTTRLQGFDYSNANCYFLTLNTYKKQPFFGEVIDGVMNYNIQGLYVKECWESIPQHYPPAKVHKFIVMPDHLHGIIEIVKEVEVTAPHSLIESESQIPEVKLTQIRRTEFKSPSKTLGSIIRGFKIGVTKWFRQNSDVYTVWQRNFHEHIIRNKDKFDNCVYYIKSNPKNYPFSKK